MLMDREGLREWWLAADTPIVCKMIDGALALLILGPRDADVAEGRWKFGFQVPGEENIRWCEPEQLDRLGNGLAEHTTDGSRG